MLIFFAFQERQRFLSLVSIIDPGKLSAFSGSRRKSRRNKSITKRKCPSYLERLKWDNPEKYRAYLDRQKIRSRKYRENIKQLSQKTSLTPEEYAKLQNHLQSVASKNRAYKERQKLKRRQKVALFDADTQADRSNKK